MKNFDIVIQGPIYDHTFNLIETYKDLSFVNKVVISTWHECKEACKKINYDNVEIIYNDEISFSGVGNRNKQIISSFNGLKACTSEYAIKIRTDTFWTEESMYQMVDFFHKYKKCNLRRIDDTKKPKGRIFCAGIYANFPFHPFDWMFWGYKEDLIDFFDIPLCNVIPTDGYHDKTRAETYLGSHYCAKFDEEIADMVQRTDLYLCDGSPYVRFAIKKSRSLGSKILKPFPKSIMNVLWYKQSSVNYYDWDLRTMQDGLWFHEHDFDDKE
jgi:hypothetical protein